MYIVVGIMAGLICGVYVGTCKVRKYVYMKSPLKPPLTM